MTETQGEIPLLGSRQGLPVAKGRKNEIASPPLDIGSWSGQARPQASDNDNDGHMELISM
jgi:hypothetical protein